MMILEIAEIDIIPGSESAFEAGVAKAAPLFRAANGCVSLDLQRSIEHLSRYRLFVRWRTLENHTVEFRHSAAFQQWRTLVGGYFAGTPRVEHVSNVLHAL
jgi:quinol monooxygenase YgiN